MSWRRLASIGAAVLASVLVCVATAAAKPPPAANGQILFNDPNSVVTTVNPDGSHLNGLDYCRLRVLVPERERHLDMR
jgi:hypothetical protein